jgi:hypothetical protein
MFFHRIKNGEKKMAKNRMKIPNSLFSFSYYTSGANKERNGVG